MWPGAIVGALTLTMGITSFAAADDTMGAPQAHQQMQQERVAGHGGPVIREAHIARLRSALNLKPEQQARDDAGGGFVSRVSDKATAMAGTAVQLRRLASAAGPLIRALDENQKNSAMSVVHSSGFGHLAAAF